MSTGKRPAGQSAPRSPPGGSSAGTAAKRRKTGRPRQSGTQEPGGTPGPDAAGGTGEQSGSWSRRAGSPGGSDASDESEVVQASLGDDSYSVRKREDQANKERLRILLEHFDSDQLDRYTEYRKSGLNKSNVRRLANAVLQQSVSERIVITTRGLAKVFVGDIVERGPWMTH